MNARNSARHYGWVAIALHWVVAVAVVGLFALGLWMTSLGYYHPWYHKGPDLHRAVGVLLFAVLLARPVWRRITPPPAAEPSHAPWERRAARCTHLLLYLLPILVCLSGYLIATADGRPVQVFGWFEVPALPYAVERQEEYAGLAHLYLAVTTVALAGLHAAAALKHHFIDHDRTLLKMLGR